MIEPTPTTESTSAESPEPTPANGKPLSPRLAALVQRARDILSGRLKVEPIPPDPTILGLLYREHGNHRPPPLPRVLERMAYEMTIDKLYHGNHILVESVYDDRIPAILAVGEEEIGAVLDHLNPEPGWAKMGSQHASIDWLTPH